MTVSSPRHLSFLLSCLLLLSVCAGRSQDSVLIINEIHYHPFDELTQTEWVEVRSLQAVDVDIAGWRIEGGIDYTFPAGTVMPGLGYLVIAKVPGQISGAVGPFVGTLDNGGETLRIVNKNGRVMDEVSYDDEGDWPVGPDGSGLTLARKLGSAAGGPSAWGTSAQMSGTPGNKNYAEPTDPPTQTTLIALNAAWKYKDDNVAQPADWKNTGFNDTAWSSGGALLYAGSPNITGAGEGLHGYWPLQETSGSVAPNLAPGGTAGSVFSGASWITDGTRGRVLLFDGIDGYVSAGNLPLMTMSNNFTWSFWAYSTQTGGNVVVGNRYSPSGSDWSPREFIKFTPSTLQYDHNQVENIDYADMPSSVWVHHAVVKTGATMDYYRNGVLSNSITIQAPQNNPQPLYFGGDKTNENWGGRLDDIATWTKALPATSIAGLANGSLTPLTAPTGSSGGALTTALAQGPTTHYFRKSFTFSGSVDRTTLILQHMLDDGAVVYLNGTEVLRVNMPAGTIAHGTPASNDLSSTGLSTATPIPSTALITGTNVIAVEVHQHTTNPDMVFGLNLVANETPPVVAPSLVFSEISGASDAGFFIELRNQSTGAISTSGWLVATSTGASIPLPAQSIPAGGYASFTAAALGLVPADGMRLTLLAPGGLDYRDAREITNRPRGLTSSGLWGHPTTATPGAANIVVVSDAIVINEIFYHGPGTSIEQWVELYNRSGAPVDVSLWKLSDGISYQFPVGTPPIPAGGYAVVAWDTAAFNTLHGFVPYGPFSGSLSGKGEKLTLRDANDNVADQLTYADSGRWSQWADGGGSSLELINPNADNSKPEAWDSSDESGQSTWQTVSAVDYQGVASNPNGSDPTTYNEFVMGLLNSGEYLIDDIEVKNVSTGSTNLIQNGNFNAGTAATWRIIGTHVGTIVDDPTAPGNKVLKVSASGGTEHMHNHAETTLKLGAAYHAINGSQTYSISFRAKWLRGSNRLHTRLWHNRLPRQTLLNMPTTGGTPGAQNSRFAANVGPTFELLSHTPVVPAAGQSATVSIKVEDPNGIAVNGVQLFTKINGAVSFSNATMSTSGGGIYTATIPAQAAGALVQFYVRATDTLGAIASFPPAGPNSRAMIPWADGRAQLQLASGARPYNIRVVLPTADATDMYKIENLMSDAARPCTVIVNESQAYYHAGVRLKSSEHGRIEVGRCGYTLEFGADDLFFGIHDTVAIDRSGGTSTGQKEMLLRRLSNTAGGIYASEDDLCRVISAVGTTGAGINFDGAGITGAAIMSKTRLDKEYLDAQFPNGGDGAMQKYERVYVLTETMDPTTRSRTTIDTVNVLTAVSENPKVPQSNTGPPGVGVNSLGTNKEFYRWYWLMQNARDLDDYTGIINVTGAIGATNQTLMNQYINVDSWLRATIPSALYGVVDNYLGSGGGQHNALVYFPPGQKAILIPWDLDFLDQSNPNAANLTNGGDLGKFLSNGAWKRLYYGHMLDILNRSFNTSYMTTWATHYSRFGTDDMVGSVSSYLTPRAAFAMSAITTAIPNVAFTRTSAASVTTSQPFITVTGDGWINIAEIRLQGSSQPLAVTWTDDNSFSLQLPVTAGTNVVYTLVAYDNNGATLGSPITVTVTATGGIFPAAPGNLAVSEIYFNPPGSTETTEFIELLNLTNATLELGGCHFDEEFGQGINYTFPNGTQVTAGNRIIVARNRTAFLAAYPSASSKLAPNQYDPSDLDNGGEELVLYAASGLEIFRFSYNDNVAGTDGDGRSLVRVLSSTAPNGSTYAWRASTVNGGNPGTSDAVNFTGSAMADLDLDGFPAILEYTFGTSDTNALSRPPAPVIAWNVAGQALVTYATVPNADDVVVAIETTDGLTNTWVPYTGPVPGASPRFFRLRSTLR